MNKKLLMNVLKVIKDGNLSELDHIPKNELEDMLRFAKNEELIRGIIGTKSGYVGKPELTLKGLEYYEENKASTKFYASLKEVKSWIPGMN